MGEIVHFFSQWGYENPNVFGIAMVVMLVYVVATLAASACRRLGWPVPEWLEFLQTFLDVAFEKIPSLKKKDPGPP